MSAEKAARESARARLMDFFGGDKAKMRRWGSKQKQFLGGLTPMRAINVPKARALLLERLTQAEHGMCA